MKNKIRIGLIIAAMGIIIADLTLVDDSNWTWSRNLGAILIILSLIIQIRQGKKLQTKLTDDGQ